MKKLLLLVSLICIINQIRSQTCDNTLPVTENFDDSSVIGVCWNVLDQDGDGNNWYWREYGSSYGGYKCLTSRSWSSSQGNLNPDNWVYSYGIDLNAFSTDDTIEVTWKIRAENASFAHEYYTMYAATGNSISDFEASPVKISEYADEVGAAGVFATRSLNVSALAGNTVYLAFRHENISGSQFLLNLDDVSISTSLLGIDDLEKNNFTHTYNPIDKTLTLNSNGLPLNSLQVFNTLGQQVISQKLDYTEEIINLSYLTKGIYICMVEIENLKRTFKFIKQ
ncbi:T9SS-dependent choice-of-anchor J family protein [Snuella sedimenti]|uniref:Choice-of-anchor J domain-containing protein n=1 Tax=Snuella sedimenti TaxID=2798802 RepID=A0A8J7LU22_9FLAO|nr:choice-of-anchor J domain-containing protein [Snuella sedimenti]MBJ6369405.1 choice-of-anchor J domain-containing protein [Snuella sedimenti]